MDFKKQDRSTLWQTNFDNAMVLAVTKYDATTAVIYATGWADSALGQYLAEQQTGCPINFELVENRA